MLKCKFLFPPPLRCVRIGNMQDAEGEGKEFALVNNRSSHPESNETDCPF